ncbi:hypothetical protein CsSME_00043686 [Camellia sinensis var. sinensis]
MRWKSRPKWRLHVDLLKKITIKEGILDIHLKKLPVASSSNSNSKQTANRGKLSNRGEDLLIINAIFLVETLGNKTSFVALNRAIRMSLDFVDPFAANCSLARRKINNIPSMSFVQNLKFISHSLLPKRISTSLTIGGGFISRKGSRPNNIITKMNRWLSYSVQPTCGRIGREKSWRRRRRRARRCKERWTIRENSLVGIRDQQGHLDERGTCIKVVREKIEGRISKDDQSGECG